MTNNDLQRKILGILSMRGNITVSQLAKHLRIRPHTVRYHLDRLRELGSIGKSISVNQRRLGYQVFNFFFDLPRSRLQKAVHFLKNRREVAWLTRNIGPRRYEATIVAKDYLDLSKLFADMGEETGTQLRDPILGIEGEFRYWGLRFLAEVTSSPPLSHFMTSTEFEEIDQLDRDIIDIFQRDQNSDSSSVAKMLGAAPSTITYRFKRLCAARIISDEFYFVRPMTHIVQGQLVLLLKSRCAAAERIILSVCNENPHIDCLVSGLGQWDYKVVIVAESVPMLLKVEDAVIQGIEKHLLRHMMFIRDEVLSVRSGL